VTGRLIRAGLTFGDDNGLVRKSTDDRQEQEK